MKVTVIGLERPAIIRQPNGIECDNCHRQVNFDRKDAKVELEILKAQGWTEKLCPDCAKEQP